MNVTRYGASWATDFKFGLFVSRLLLQLLEAMEADRVFLFFGSGFGVEIRG